MNSKKAKMLRKYFCLILALGMCIFFAPASASHDYAGEQSHSKLYTDLISGKTTSRTGTVARNADGSYTAKGQVVGPKGNAATVDKTMTKNDDGSRSMQKTVTTSSGKPMEMDKTMTKNDDGSRSMQKTVTTPSGKTMEIDKTLQKTDTGVVNKTKTVTNQDGKTWTKDVEMSKDENSITKNVTKTNPEGETKSYTSSATVDK